MALINKDGGRISFECSALIKELEADIAEFGNFDLVAITINKSGVVFIRDYSFLDLPAQSLEPDEVAVNMKATSALAYMRKQNALF